MFANIITVPLWILLIVLVIIFPLFVQQYLSFDNKSIFFCVYLFDVLPLIKGRFFVVNGNITLLINKRNIIIDMKKVISKRKSLLLYVDYNVVSIKSIFQFITENEGCGAIKNALIFSFISDLVYLLIKTLKQHVNVNNEITVVGDGSKYFVVRTCIVLNVLTIIFSLFKMLWGNVFAKKR